MVTLIRSIANTVTSDEWIDSSLMTAATSAVLKSWSQFLCQDGREYCEISLMMLWGGYL